MKRVSSKPMRDGAKGQMCVRCGCRSATTVGAHYQGLRAFWYGKGKGLKPTDLAIADLCDTCHQYFDGYANKRHKLDYDEKISLSEEFMHCILLTLHRRVEQGIITVKGHDA